MRGDSPKTKPAASVTRGLWSDHRHGGTTRAPPVTYGVAMVGRLAGVRARFRSTLTPEQQRGLSVLGWVSFVILAGLTGTGLWQFFAHESDPSWFEHVVGSDARLRATPSEGVAELHSIFATAGGIVALLGGAWFAYKIAFDIPWIALLAFVLAVVGSVTGSLIRFNAVKLPGRSYEDAGRGYLQFFVNDVEHIVTDKWDLGSTAIRLLTVSHFLTVPLLLTVAWFRITRVGEPER